MSSDPSRPWAGRKCVFSFTTDDGNDDNVDWQGVFDDFGYRMTAFVNSSKIGNTGKMTLAELKAFAAAGHEVGSHSNSNVTLPPLDDATLASEVDRAPLEALIGDGYVVKSFAYVQHDHFEREMKAVKDAGYIAARNSGYASVDHLSTYRNRVFEIGRNVYQRYEIPIRTQLSEIVAGNANDEATTRARLRTKANTWKNENSWEVSIAHTLTADIDTTHLEWLLDEISLDPDIWVLPFHAAIEYLDLWHRSRATPP